MLLAQILHHDRRRLGQELFIAQLPLAAPDASFDLVVSMYGAMFAPRPERVATELLRVCRSGGQIAMANWTPSGFIGQMFKVNAAHVPPPAGMPSPVLWGDEATVRERLRNGIADLKIERVQAQLRYPFSVADTVAFHRTHLGPARMAIEATPVDQRAALEHEMVGLYEKYNRAKDGTVWVESEYLEVVATRA